VSPGLLRCERVSVSFGETHVLHEVALELEPGEVHMLIGRNGAGLGGSAAKYEQSELHVVCPAMPRAARPPFFNRPAPQATSPARALKVCVPNRHRSHRSRREGGS
jgi:hypothetical protein